MDIGASELVHRQLIAARDAGAAVLLVSADLGEVLALSDRLAVMYNGEIVARFTDVPALTEEELGYYMLGVKRQDHAESKAAKDGNETPSVLWYRCSPLRRNTGYCCYLLPGDAMNRRAVLIEVLRVAIVIVVALVLSFLVILIVSKEPGEAFKQFITAPLANRNRQGNWLVQATALTFTGLSVALVFQARQFALGAEGQLYLGGLAAGIVALYLPGSAWVVAIVAFLAAALVGFLYGLIPGYLKAYFGANEIVSTLMLNAIATAGYAFILVRYLRIAGGNYSASFTVFGPTGRMQPLI